MNHFQIFTSAVKSQATLHMRYFTPQWHSGELSDAASDAVPLDYWNHLTALKLPSDVLALAETDIHDGVLLDVQHQPQSASLTLRLCCGDGPRGYFHLSLRYVSASIDPASLSVLSKAMARPNDEFLYDEIHRIGNHFEHRVLLASHKETCVRFANVEIATRPVQTRTFLP